MKKLDKNLTAIRIFAGKKIMTLEINDMDC